jgi:hypothetical protein
MCTPNVTRGSLRRSRCPPRLTAAVRHRIFAARAHLLEQRGIDVRRISRARRAGCSGSPRPQPRRSSVARWPRRPPLKRVHIPVDVPRLLVGEALRDAIGSDQRDLNGLRRHRARKSVLLEDHVVDELEALFRGQPVCRSRGPGPPRREARSRSGACGPVAPTPRWRRSVPRGQLHRFGEAVRDSVEASHGAREAVLESREARYSPSFTTGQPDRLLRKRSPRAPRDPARHGPPRTEAAPSAWRRYKLAQPLRSVQPAGVIGANPVQRSARLAAISFPPAEQPTASLHQTVGRLSATVVTRRGVGNTLS